MNDAFGRPITYLRLSVTELCNLRCRYCMPAEGIVKRRHEDMLTEEEMLLAVRAAASLGIRKVRITGGEPLVKHNILSICRRVAQVEGIEELALTTNGTLLDGFAASLHEAGVDRLNISIDTLNPAKYASMTRIGSIDDFWRGFDAALGAGFSRIKLNTVLIGGFNDDEIPALADLTRQYPVDLRFIELMPMQGGSADIGAYLSCSAVLDALPNAEPLPSDGGVAALYRLPNALGRIGLIRPISDAFCSSCNRLRLTADGRIKPCLHLPIEYPIKGLDYAEMRAQFEKAIAEKPPCRGPLDAEHRSSAGRAMNRIGG